ncbi:Coenzyme F420 hydrogenase/dehydrogenase, beta subunit C-terminal domain [Brenneria tiliae]|uniref:Coenzyme F420 hydrogenase/dehydrogenase, beta subunit C-terminal domain n=1 Tax=Brenneria tiliae TaxID=2914984 RepID=A0ABT0MXS3_9GAMM|nr:Coenzyme F420 hydrogenase/dehydrogenase, beta subunit C-terminal domain [Brenneria tiliae]MCL2894646.1 Coenzyme F420 hydrogenase/dehydrogenase, beta subunit C-terminal domain [Brenneria tiliae]
MTDLLERRINKVINNGNCCGCGGCVHISKRIDMELNDQGYMRPCFSKLEEDKKNTFKQQIRNFERICPGVRIDTVNIDDSKSHPIFGTYVSVWSGWAVDKDIRHSGSSGGVLTALSGWLLASGKVKSVIGSQSSKSNPYLTVPEQASSVEQVITMAGSRYAPVSNVTKFDPTDSDCAFVGKPCEVYAANQLSNKINSEKYEKPILLSFFCAGTPSQIATNKLIDYLGVPLNEVKDLRYRGNGWPGDFTVTSFSKQIKKLSYDDSWGNYLGRELQWRCKLCVDGTGEHADISVGDFWKADEKGYPTFDDGDGNSVVIARTHRGHQLLQDALKYNIIHLESIDLDDVAKIQPLQVDRKITLLGRLIARILAFKSIPHYYGYNLFKVALLKPKKVIRSVIGTYVRTVFR